MVFNICIDLHWVHAVIDHRFDSTFSAGVTVWDFVRIKFIISNYFQEA